jgi:hypothetical protein
MKIITRLGGGIGNQLFQYLAGKSLAARLNCEHFVDVSSFVDYSFHHDFELKKIDQNIEVLNIDTNINPKGTYLLQESLGIKLSSINPLSLPGDCTTLILKGYWQHEDHFSQEVANEFYDQIRGWSHTISSSYINSLGIDSTFISLHLRRRDYLHMGICKEEYYIGAAKFLVEKYSGAKILVFSDEPNYSHFFLSTYFADRLKVVKSGHDFVDLYIMSRSKAIVISNSTFSWWGAYFNERGKDLVIAPDPWILIDATVQPCPQRWIKLPLAVSRKFIDNDVVRNYEEIVKKNLVSQ